MSGRGRDAWQSCAPGAHIFFAIFGCDSGGRCILLEERARHRRAEDQQERRMREEQIGGETVYRVYERERLRQMARKLGLRLVKFSGGERRARKSSGEPSRIKQCPVVTTDAWKRTLSE
jgi:hypothetical protein